MNKRLFTILFIIFLFLSSAAASANTYYVDSSATPGGNGSISSPFQTINEGLSSAYAGDTVYVRAGNYLGTVVFPRGGNSETERITLKAYGSESVFVSNTGKVLDLNQPYITIENIVFDANWADVDAIMLRTTADYFVLRGSEVKNTRRDCINMGSPEGVLIENTVIHDCIWVDNGNRRDAHGIVTSGVKNLTIRNTEIYYVSGDAVQLQYGGWDNVLIENSTLWNGPLPTARGGAPAGVYPGENAVDTKYYIADGRGRLFIKNTTAYGWRSDYITNAAAFNIKHNVEAVFDGIITYDNEIAFRLRGPGSKGGARVTLKNAVIYDSDKGVRYEDRIENLRIYNTTFGANLSSQFQSVGGYGSGFEVKNSLFLGQKPTEASDSSNLAVNSSAFRDVSANDYYLSLNSPAIDNGIFIAEVTIDRDGVTRPQGSGYDIGAYEFGSVVDSVPPSPPTNLHIFKN